MAPDEDKQTTEVRETNERQGNTKIHRQTVATSSSVDGVLILGRIVYYIAGVIVTLLVLRIILLLLGANQGSPFVDLIYSVSGAFAWPFFGIFNYQPTYGQSTFEISSLVAIVIYALLAVGIVKLLTLAKPTNDA